MHLALALAFAPGCSGLPSYGARVTRLHKDTLHVLIQVPRRLSPEAYRRIALRELERLAGEAPRPEHPLYEVQLDFVLPAASGSAERVATLTWRAGSPSSPALLARDAPTLVLY